ncbi:MAG: hypothetical protein N2662_03435 [Bacteroidales bacterium]|nr:hypothetical protein [Bacteroidales bacterium]
MFLRFARSTQPYVLIILSLILGTIWFTVPVTSYYCIAPHISTFHWLNNLSNSTAFLARLLGYFSLIIMASLVIQLNTKYLFIGQRSYLPGFIFLLLSLIFHQTQNFHFIFWVGILLLFAIDRIISTYRYENLSYRVFDAALLTGLSAIFYPPALFLLVFFYITLLLLRPFYWREWVLLFIGLVLPFYFLFAYLFFFDYPESAAFITSYFDMLRFKCTKLQFSTIETITLYFVLFISFISSLHLIRTMGNIKILARKSFYLFFFLAICLLLLYLFVPQTSKEIFVLMAIPFSYLLAFYFQSGKTTRLKIILFDMMVIAIILIRYIHGI